MRTEKQLHRLFLLYLVLSVVVFVGAWALVIVLAEEPLFFLYFLTIMVALMLAISLLRNRINYVTNESYLVRINNHPAGPLPVKRAHNQSTLRQYLLSKDFEQYSQDSAHSLYYRVTKDEIKKMFRGYTLEIVVYTSKIEPEFYLEIVDEEVQAIQEKLRVEKKRVAQILVTQIKQVDELSDTIKARTKEVFFMRIKNMIMSTINVTIDLSTYKAILLYSDTYSPILYYKKHVDFIKKTI